MCQAMSEMREKIREIVVGLRNALKGTSNFHEDCVVMDKAINDILALLAKSVESPSEEELDNLVSKIYEREDVWYKGELDLTKFRVAFVFAFHTRFSVPSGSGVKEAQDG